MYVHYKLFKKLLFLTSMLKLDIDILVNVLIISLLISLLFVIKVILFFKFHIKYKKRVDELATKILLLI